MRASALAGAALLCAALLSGCAATVALDAAPDANNPGCAEIIVRLPSAVDGKQLRQTNSQATGAWGNPAVVLLRCGIPIPGPTTMPCVEVDGIDWLVDNAKAPETVRYVTFGRSPATEVIIDHTKAADSNVLPDLAQAIASIPATKKCTNLNDTFSTATPTPAP
jgi:hypothetical protein